jgi:hypothetical protein
MISNPFDRAQKLAAHGSYDTNEGRIARRFLAVLIAAHPTIGETIGWHVGANGEAARGAGPAQPFERAPSRPAAPRPTRPPSPPPQETRRFQLRTPHQVHLASALRAKHGLRLRYIQGITPGEPMQVEVTGAAPAVAAYEEEWSRCGDTLEAILDEIASMFADELFPGVVLEWEASSLAEPNPANPEAVRRPKRNAWMLRAMEWERRVRRMRAFMPLERFRPVAREAVRVAMWNAHS